jgi:hypothetical protein
MWSMGMEKMNHGNHMKMSLPSMGMENMNHGNHMKMTPPSMGMENMNHGNHMKMETMNKTMCPPGEFNNEDCDCGPERMKSKIDSGLSICLPTTGN